jgi:hypothetical protein
MIFTSKYTNLTAPTAGRGKRGFFALGEAAQKKLYTAEYVPSSAGEPGLIFSLLSLPHAAVGIPPSLPGMAHSGTVRGGITALQATLKCATGGQPAQRRYAISDRRPGCERETHRNIWGMQSMAPTGVNFAANQPTNHQPAPVPREMSP